MIFEKLLSAINYNLKEAMTNAGSAADVDVHLTNAQHFFEMAINDIRAADKGQVNKMVDKMADDKSGEYTQFQDTEDHISEVKPINESKLEKALNNYKRLF